MSKKWWIGLSLLWTLSSLAAEPLDTIQRLGGFRSVDLARLLAGEILTERGALMDFPNGISAQTCFALAAPPAEVVQRLQVWDPTAHRELKVLAFQVLPVPCHPENFARLQFESPLRTVRWLLEKTVATSATKSVLNLSQHEVVGLTGSPNPQRVAAGWARLLANRGAAFQQQGWDGIAPYELAGPATSPVTQLRALLHDQAEIAMEFAPVLRTSGLLSGAAGPALAPIYYWSWFEANHHSILCLGAVYQHATGPHYQLADVEYYVSGDYYTAMTLYEIWPVAGGTLVWRVDLFAAPMLAYTKGVERLAYEVLMVQEIKQETRLMRDDLGRK